MLNSCSIIGNLGADIDLRTTGSGKSVATMSVACTEAWGSGDDRKENTEWFRVVMWEKLAETCAKFLAKGSRVFVEGRIQTRKWEDQEGVQRYSTELMARKVVFLSSKQGERGAPHPGTSERADAPAEASVGAEQPRDDDFPF